MKNGMNKEKKPIVLISSTDCSGKKPLEGPLKAELEDALALAERFTQQYDSLLRRFEERMANTSFILDLLNRQFGWVSSLANRTDGRDNIFNIQTVRLRTKLPQSGERKHIESSRQAGVYCKILPAAGDLQGS